MDIQTRPTQGQEMVAVAAAAAVGCSAYRLLQLPRLQPARPFGIYRLVPAQRRRRRQRRGSSASFMSA